MSGPGPYGPGRRGEPHEAPGGRGGVPFGPEVSWPNGFRQIDPEARRLLEAGYGPSGQGRGQYDHVDPGYGTAGRGSGYRSADPSPSLDDYGDPGYSDPTYDGPRGGSGARGWPGDPRGLRAPGGSSASDGGYGGVPGYHVPDYREPARPDAGYQQGYPASGIYPVTGAQEALPDTGPQPIADSWPGRPARPGYTEQRYDTRASAPRPDGPPAADPRLEGMRYDELRYDEPFAGGPRYDEPLDDDAWVAELRRSAPAYPQSPAGDQRRGDPRGGGQGQQQPGWGPSSGSYPQAFGYGQSRDDRNGPGSTPSRGPRMSAGLETRPRPPAAPQDYPAQVGVLTPPAVRRLEDPADTGPRSAAPLSAPPAVSAAASVGASFAAPAASQVLAPPVRPGHGLDGPEITSSWPAQPQVDEQETFDEFWAEDDDDADYGGLFPDENPDFDARRKGARTRRIGRRRGRSNDHRLWLALLGVVVAAGAAIFGILKFEFPSQSGPTHQIVAPDRIGNYVRTADMEKETKVNELRDEVIKMSSGQASDVVSAVYDSGNSAAGSTEQIVMFIGGHLANAAPGSSIASFTQKFAGASVVSAGSLGGQAACVEEAPGTSDSVAMCVWFDNDSFGEIVSPTMSATSLSTVMRTMRPSLELVK
jgi:hypothetical protein